jgi:Galactose oxidase, central domain/Kelch motif
VDLSAALGLSREAMNRSEKPIQISRSEPHGSSISSTQYVTFTRAALVTIPESSLSVRRMGSAPSLSQASSPLSAFRSDSRTALGRSTSTRPAPQKQQLPQRSLSLSKALPPPPPSLPLSQEAADARRHGGSVSGLTDRQRHNSLSKRSARPLPHISSLLELKEADDQPESELTRHSRRKLSTASSNKSGNKETTRSRATSGATSGASLAKSENPPPGRSNATGALKSAVSFPSSAVEGEGTSAPIFGSVAGGSFRNNIFGRTRERGSSKGEKAENEDERRNYRSVNPVISPTGDSSFNGGRGRGPGEFSNAGLSRKLSGRRRNKHSPSPNRDNISGNNSADEDNASHTGRRGSVIGKVAQKAKMVLPLKRNSKDAKHDGSKSLAVKTSPSSSSFQESPRAQMLTSPEAETSSEGDDDDEKEAENGKRSNTLTDRPKVGASKPKTISFAANNQKSNPPHLPAGEKDSRPSSSSTKKEHSPAVSPSSSGFGPAEGILRPRSVPPRKASITDATHPREAMPPVSIAAARRSNKILELSPAELRPPETPSDSLAAVHTLSPVKAQTTTGSIGIESKRNLSTTAIEVMGRPTSHPSPGEPVQQTLADPPDNKSTTPTQRPSTADRPSALRQASAGKVNTQVKTPTSSKPKVAPPSRQKKHPPSLEPPMPDPGKSPKVDPAPPSGMYWSRAPCYGHDRTSLRAHTATLVGSGIYVFGGCDSKTCFNDLYVFDADSMFWSKPECTGDVPPPLRAMTTTAVGKKLIIFGGGDGPTYYNDIYILDTISFRYTKPKVSGVRPSKRRAHTACLYKNGIYVFGGGDGVRALNDVWRLDVSDLTKLSWRLISAPTSPSSKPTTAQAGTTMANGKSSRDQGSPRPTARGYHTANMVGTKLIIFGGSDGVECFRDVWVFDVDTLIWKSVDIKVSYPRLSHTATVVGSYLFVIGGHDGVEYSSDVLLLNLVTMQWDRRKVYGLPPSGRGYHGTALHDSRLFVLGGFDGYVSPLVPFKELYTTLNTKY